MNTILKVTNLSKSYSIGEAEPQPILHDINLSVEQGEFVSIMGASGSGKSTLLYNISGMDQPTGGTARLLDQQLTDLSEKELAKLRLSSIGYIFQQSNLLRNLTLFDNIALPAYRAGKESRRVINKRADNLMKHLGIAELADKDISQASGGQLQRVSICRALINNPAFIFGDEPTGALNSSAAAEVMDILTEINTSGTTILLVTHDVKVAAGTRRVLFMADGRIVGEKRFDQLAQNETEIKQRENFLMNWLQTQGF